MIVAALSSALGLFGGILPDIMKEVRETRDHGRQIAMLKAQSDYKMKELDYQRETKLAEFDMDAVLEQLKAQTEQMKHIYEAQKPIGNSFVDGWNASIRPATATFLMILFVAASSAFGWGVIEKFRADEIDIIIASEMFLGGIVGEAIQAVLGYLFGYRTSGAVKRLVRGRG